MKVFLGGTYNNSDFSRVYDDLTVVAKFFNTLNQWHDERLK